MKRLTVNETWELELAMWKWVSRQCKGKSKEWCRLKGERLKGERLKGEWLVANGYKEDNVDHRCFFCDRCPKSTHDGILCMCPAKKVDKEFNCMTEPYWHSKNPRLFYAELKRLNKIRLAK